MQDLNSVLSSSSLHLEPDSAMKRLYEESGETQPVPMPNNEDSRLRR